MSWRFLRWQYYAVFKEDPELPYLISSGFLTSSDSDRLILGDDSDRSLPNLISSSTTSFSPSSDSMTLRDTLHTSSSSSSSSLCENGNTTTLHPSVLKKRLEMFLTVFSAVISPKQLYLHNQLFDYYNSILSRSETNIVKLAFDCILGFKPAYLMPVRENIRRLLDDKKMRDELVIFDPSVGAVGGGGFAGVISGSSAAVDEGQLGVSWLTINTNVSIAFLISCIALYHFNFVIHDVYKKLVPINEIITFRHYCFVQSKLLYYANITWLYTWTYFCFHFPLS